MEEDDKRCPMIRMGVSGWVFLLVPAYPGCPGPKAVKRLCVCVCVMYVMCVMCVMYCSRTGCVGMGMCCEKKMMIGWRNVWSMKMMVQDARGRPKRTWRKVVWEDCQARKMNKEDAIDRCKWRKMIKHVRWSGWVWVGECFFWYRPTLVVPDQRPLNGCVCVCVCNVLFHRDKIWIAKTITNCTNLLQVFWSQVVFNVKPFADAFRCSSLNNEMSNMSC